MVNKHNVYKIGGIDYVREDNETESDGLCKSCRAKLEEEPIEDFEEEEGPMDEPVGPLDEDIEDFEDSEPLKDDNSSDTSAPVTNTPPCEQDSTATCPYADMECSTCKAMTDSERDVMEEMKNLRDTPSLEHIRKLTRGQKSPPPASPKPTKRYG